METICIDARFWGVGHTGIGRYVEKLIEYLPESKEFKIVLIVHPDLKNEPKLAKFEKYYAKQHLYSFASLIEIGWLLIKIQPDLLHISHLTVPWFWPGKIVVTIHDLIKHYNPGPKSSTRGPIMYWIKYFEYLIMTWIGVRRANHIIVPTNYWKEELITRYGISGYKITIINEGVEQKLFSASAPQIDLPDHRPYVLYVGNVYPHKNIPLLLEAIKELNGEVLLIIVCARSVFAERVEKIIVEKNLQQLVKFWGIVPDEILVSLYQNALAYVFPSLIEGFGLPGLEAMAAGTPVISANASCLPEVYQDAALYFDPRDAKDLATKIRLILTDAKLRQSLIVKGKKQVKKYTWPKMAKQTWQIYQQELH